MFSNILKAALGAIYILCCSGCEVEISSPPKQERSSVIAGGVLSVNPENPRYFSNDSRKAIFLTGSHTWANLQDFDDVAFDFSQYLSLIVRYNHNFIRLWTWEQPKGITTWPDPTKPMAILEPEIFNRFGPEKAEDGGLKFNLYSFNQDYFDRIRKRIIAAGKAGIYVSVMLFNGWSIEKKAGGENPWKFHPFNRNNNINGIDGDLNKDNSGSETHTLLIPLVTKIQEAYVRKVVDTTNDLDNVLFEISNESKLDSIKWQYHMINYIKSYEKSKPKQHPVGMTVIHPDGSNADLWNSPADWISPNANRGYKDNPPPATGEKVLIIDTDHLWGIGGDRFWAWKSFTRGMNLIYMDPWDGNIISVEPNENLRINMGYILYFANRMNLKAMIPKGYLASTGYCLANTEGAETEYLIYLPMGGNVTVDFSFSSGIMSVEWFNPKNGTTTKRKKINGGNAISLTAPFLEDAVLYIKQEPINE